MRDLGKRFLYVYNECARSVMIPATFSHSPRHSAWQPAWPEPPGKLIPTLRGSTGAARMEGQTLTGSPTWIVPLSVLVRVLFPFGNYTPSLSCHTYCAASPTRKKGKCSWP